MIEIVVTLLKNIKKVVFILVLYNKMSYINI